MDKKKLLKIIIPVIIVVAIAGIWLLKNHEKELDLNFDDAMVTPSDEQHFVLNDKVLDIEVLSEYGLPIVIDFGSDSCLPCVSFYPTLKTVHANMYGRAIIKYIDVNKYPETVEGYLVRVIPTQIFINADGTPYVPSKKIDLKFTRYDYNDSGEHAFTVHEGVLTQKQFLAILEDMGVVQ